MRSMPTNIMKSAHDVVLASDEEDRISGCGAEGLIGATCWEITHVGYEEPGLT